MFKKFLNYIWLEVAKKSVFLLVICVLKRFLGWGIIGYVTLGHFILKKRFEIVENPVKLFNSSISKSDAMFLAVQKELKECNATGIFAGIFIYADKIGKFAMLQGRWDVKQGLNVRQKQYLEDPSQVKDENMRGILHLLNNFVNYLEYDNTKFTNPEVYLTDFNEDSAPCKIDEGTKQVYSSDLNMNKVADYSANENYNFRTPFTQCILDKLLLPKFNQKLKAIYIYPIKVSGADFVFLTLTSTNAKEGACFSKDLKKQKVFFQKIQEIANHYLKI